MTYFKRVGYVAFFVLVIFVGDIVVARLARSIVRRSQNQFVRMYEGKYAADLLFLGDSRVDRNFNFRKIRELTRKRCLNLGLGGNSVLVSEVLLKDYVHRYGIPEHVLLEMNQTTTDPRGIGEMRIFSYCSRNMSQLADRLDPIHARFSAVFRSLRFNDPAFWRLATEVLQKPESRMLQNQIPPEKKRKWANRRKFERSILRENMDAIRRICDFSDSNNIRLTLLIGPSWKPYHDSISNFPEWVDALEEAAGKHAILDFSGLFFDQPEYFNDEIHLNARGATRFVEILVEKGILNNLD